MMSIYQVQIDDDNANDADHQDDHHQTKEVKGDAYTEGRRARAVGHSARHRFLIIIYIIYTRPDTGGFLSSPIIFAKGQTEVSS